MLRTSTLVADPQRRQNMRAIEEWAASRTPSEVDAIEEEAKTALRTASTVLRDGRGKVQ